MGLGWRLTQMDVQNSFPISFTPDSRSDHLFSAFLQDEIRLLEDRVRLTLGSKIEYNDYTGFEIQPSGRLLWAINNHHSVWGAVSRVVRTPSSADQGVRLNIAVFPLDPASPFGPTAVVSVVGNPDFQSEELITWELGYRVNLFDRLSLDVAGFYNRYRDLRSIQAVDPLTFMAFNEMEGESWGVEAAADVEITEKWRLKAAYTYLKMRLDEPVGGVPGEDAATIEGEAPRNQVSVRSLMNIGRRVTLDAWLRYVDSLSSQDVDAYTTLDLRLGWRPLEHLEFAVVGRNLLDEHHLEYVADFLDIMSTEVPRSIYGKFIWRF
jgi:iron complex outermembrane receptor protein